MGLRLYIAGPMRGIEDFNSPAFFEAEEHLTRAGFSVENPARNPAGRLVDHFRQDAERISKCDGVVVLPGWEDSKGAMLEVLIAEYLDMPVYLHQSIVQGEPCLLVRSPDGASHWHKVPFGVTGMPSYYPGEVFESPQPACVKAVPQPKTRFEELLGQMQALHDRKKSDYTGGNTDILFNYRASGELAHIGVVKSVFARLCEKVVRVSSILSKGGDTQVKDETVEDTCLDLAIISLLLRIAFEQERQGAVDGAQGN